MMTVKSGENFHHKNETSFDYSIELIKRKYEDSPETFVYWELQIDNKAFLFKYIRNAQEFVKKYKK